MTVSRFVGCVLVQLVASEALANDLPRGLLRGRTATPGREDVATYGFEAPGQPAREDKDTTELRLSAGGLMSGGNASSLALTSSTRFRIRRQENQLTAAVAANYGSSVPEGETESQVSVENVQGRLRYDRFLNERLTVLLGLTALKDRFQGLDLRVNVDPGLGYYFVDEEKHRWWTELGYDLQYDYRRADAIAAGLDEGRVLERAAVRHSARLFVGYENNLTETIAFDTGFEYLEALHQPENLRLNWDVALTSRIAGNFSIASTFSLRYDNNPLPGVENTDYTTSVSLVYQLL